MTLTRKVVLVSGWTEKWWLEIQPRQRNRKSYTNDLKARPPDDFYEKQAEYLIFSRMLLLLCMVFRKVIFRNGWKHLEPFTKQQPKPLKELIRVFHAKFRLCLSLRHSREDDEWGRFIPSCRWNEHQVPLPLSVLQMKPVNKKEPKGSGLHRLHKTFMCSIEFDTFFVLIGMNDNVASAPPQRHVYS